VASERDSIPEPRDLAEAREIIATLAQRLVYAERKTLLLQHELEVLLRRIFGRRSEKLTADERQLLLTIVEGQGIAGQGAVEADSGERLPREARERKKARPHGRQVLPAELPRRVEVVDVPEAERTCARCGQEKVEIGQDVSEKPEYVPASLHVVQTRRV